MKFKRRTKIITETERTISVRVTRKPKSFFCDRCSEQAEMLSINETATLIGKPWREIVRQIESGEVHSNETAGGEIYVCAQSLLDSKR